MRRQCQKFAVDLLDQSRSSQELAIILNHDPNAPPYSDGDRMTLARLELAINYKQKKVCVYISFLNCKYCIRFFFYFQVCSSSEYSTIAIGHVVRRRSRISPKGFDSKTDDYIKSCVTLPSVLCFIYDCTKLQYGNFDAETAYEIFGSCFLLLIFFV